MEVVMNALVLSRKAGESINIGDDVVIKIEKIKGGLVKVLIYAPEETLILRTELTENKHNYSDLFLHGGYSP